MVKLNHHYQKLAEPLLSEGISQRLREHCSRHSCEDLIDLSIGNPIAPLPASIVEALSAACLEMSKLKIDQAHLSPPSQGYSFLREKISANDYADLEISPNEIFISDGSKCDLSNIQEIFSTDNRIALTDPTPPICLDSNIMAGRTRLPLKGGRYGGIVYLPCTESNEFKPTPPNVHADLIYLSSPNSLTGITMDRALLKKWVNYAKESQAVILFDGAYSSYITSDAPRSIYEIEGAKEVAIEFRSYSKTASFTALRSSYLVIPEQLEVQDTGKKQSLHALWKRRSETKFNGVSYPIQKATAALYEPQGVKEIRDRIQSCSAGTRVLREGLRDLGHIVYGGIDAPLIWLKAPASMDSWQFFDFLLEKGNVLTLPGTLFGQMGKGFVRLSSYLEVASAEKLLSRIQTIMEK